MPSPRIVVLLHRTVRLLVTDPDETTVREARSMVLVRSSQNRPIVALSRLGRTASV